MILLDRPYVSKHFLNYLERSGQPVLETPFTAGLARDYGLNLVDDAEAEKRCRNGDKPKSLPPSSAFDYDRLAAHFAKVLELRKVDVPELPVFGFAFTESDAERTEELDTILQSDLTEFLR